MFSLVLLAVFAQPAPETAAPSGVPPTQVVASIDAKGKLTITYATVLAPASSEHTITIPQTKGTDKAPVKAKVKITQLQVTMAEIAAEHVEAFTVGGRPITREQLTTLLAKERPVLVAVDGKKVDPFFLRLYKDDTIVLVPPTNALAPAGGLWGGYGGYGDPVPAPSTPPVEPVDKPKAPGPDRPTVPSR
jgi:hypothetical protein